MNISTLNFKVNFKFHVSTPTFDLCIAFASDLNLFHYCDKILTNLYRAKKIDKLFGSLSCS